MKKLISLTGLLAVLISTVVAQESNEDKVPCRKTFLGIQTGINNHSGLLGIGVEQGILPQWSAGAGVGIGSWGTKFYVQGRYYFKPLCLIGSALSLTYTRASGLVETPLKVETNYYGKVEAEIDGDPMNNLALTYDRFWALGKRKRSKLHLSVGYALRLNSTVYTFSDAIKAEYPGIAPTKQDDRVIRNVAPGGIVIGLGYYFGL